MNTRNDTLRRGGPKRSVPSLVLLLLAPALAAAAVVHPPTSGVIVVEAALDSVQVRELELGAGERTWSWDWGALTVDRADVRRVGADLRVPYGTDLSGVSRGQRLVFAADVYPVDGPLLLVGEGFRLFVSRGELVIEDGRIVLRDRRPPPNLQSQMLLLLGVLLLTGTLMIRARRRLGSPR